MLYRGYFDTSLLQGGTTVYRGDQVAVRRYDRFIGQVGPLKFDTVIGSGGLEGKGDYLSGVQSHPFDRDRLLYGLLE
jgi:hypothetical protein